jgi:hypothetical protein
MNAMIVGIEGALSFDIANALKQKEWEISPAPQTMVEITDLDSKVDLVIAPLSLPISRILQDAWRKRRESNKSLRIIYCCPVLTAPQLRLGTLRGGEAVVTPDRIVSTLLEPPPYHLGC